MYSNNSDLRRSWKRQKSTNDKRTPDMLIEFKEKEKFLSDNNNGKGGKKMYSSPLTSNSTVRSCFLSIFPEFWIFLFQ